MDKEKDKEGGQNAGSKEGSEKADDVNAGQPEGLNLVRRGLYAREEPDDLKQRQEALKNLGITRRPKGDLEKKGDTLASSKFKNLALLRARRTGRMVRFGIFVLVGVFVAVWAVVMTVWYRSTLKVTEDNVLVAIEAPLEFTAGDEIIYIVKYQNDSRVDWQDVELVLVPPRGFTYRGSNVETEQSGKEYVYKVGDLVSGDTGEVHLRGQLIGEQNETAAIRAEMFITPENFPSGRFSKVIVQVTTITALPLDVGLAIPKDAANGERVVATVSVRNLSSHDLNDVKIKIKPAERIELATDDVDFSDGFETLSSGWSISKLPALGSRDFSFVFYVSGQPGEKRIVDVQAILQQDDEEFLQRQLTHVVSISASELVIEQVFNGSSDAITVGAGELISGKVKYQNVGTVGLKDVIIELAFKGSSFDPGSINLTSGSYDPVGEKIVWTAGTVLELGVVQPQQQGEINFTFNILPLEKYNRELDGGQNNLLVTVATIDSPDLPTPVGTPRKVVSDRAVVSVKTDMLLTADAFYDDGRLGIISSGPLPPEVGQTTSYTLRFRLGSTLNDLGQVQMTAGLPDGVSYTGQSYQTAGEFTVNDRTGEIIWSVPFIEGWTGRASPPHELHLQVAITPGENRRGDAVDLLNRMSGEGQDLFTDEAIESVVGAFPTTASAVSGQGVVE